ncbi:MarR family winged helix-turn-helix transcriptional regulator [Cystobacter ferrugineus]|uniref:HTH marR-type domain-containing protein n=1 Tax=Cystobacter ferrugineus TaxID=83449 RepID=A0A1L9BB38_9BACT|nr:MarR family transcriptional regulator [Cystobacter ferrugineus]OJH39480.1 hypothetical protein BON30_18460 [Cystobacter ferrugineus]
MASKKGTARADFGLKLLQLGRLWRHAVDAEIQRDTFPDAGWRALFWLHRLGEGPRQKELAAAMGIEGPSLVRLLDGLCGAGLVLREADGADGRAYRLRLTPEGRTAARRIEARLRKAEDVLLDGIGEEELARCAALLGLIEDRLLARRGERR